MSMKELVIREFEVRVFDESYSRIYKCLGMISDDQLWQSPNKNVPAIGCLILHLCGNARQWILSGLGGEEDNRNRDGEFEVHSNIRKSDLVFLLENMKIQIQRSFKELPAIELERTRNIQGFNVSGFSAIVHVLEHFSYHTGQITTLTKIFSGSDTGYYTDLNLNVHNN